MTRPVRGLVLLLATVLLLAPVVPFVAVGGATAAPAGMTAIPDANVADNAPAGETIPLSAAELDGGVMASQHADSLEVVLTTADHASEVMDSDSAAVSGDGMAIVLRDDVNSAGREVAIDAGLLQQALGYRPEAIYGTHEDGSEWTRSAEYVDGYLVFEVPHFSSNTVTFSGEIRIDATSVTNGTQFEYDVSAGEDVSDASVTLTGVSNTKSKTRSGSLTGGSNATVSVDPGGNQPITEGSVTLSGSESRNGQTYSSDEYERDLFMKQRESELTIDNTGGPTEISGIVIHNMRNDGSSDIDVDIGVDNGQADGTHGGYAVKDLQLDTGRMHGTYRIDFGKTIYVNDDIITFEFDVTGNDGYSRGSVLAGDENVIDGGSFDGSVWSRRAEVDVISSPGDVTVETSTGDSTTVPSLGSGYETKPINITKDTSSVDITTSGGGSVDYDIDWQETTMTTNPGVVLTSDNGTQSINYAGTLTEGETIDLSGEVDASLISGNVTLTAVADSSSSGPETHFDLNYSHSAQDQVSTTYTASPFEESYSISHTYADATTNAETTIPFSSSRVVGIKSAEYRVNGGNWQPLTAENYRFEDTTMSAYLADAYGSALPSGATAELRVTARKISVNDGAVTVTDPTAPGEELDTQLYIDNRGQNFNVDVGPTRAGDRVHYAYSDVFPTEDYVVVQADGSQKLYLPNSKVGDTFRVSHLDTRVVAERGDVRIDVVSAGENPELDVSPGPGGPGDPVTVEYYNTKTGVTYLLNSLTRSIVVDSDVAESPAIFEDDDSEDTWAILRDSGVTSSSSSSGAVGQFTERASGAVGSISLPIDGSGLGQLALVGVLGLGGLLVLRRINPFGSSSSTPTRSSRSTASGSGPGRLAGLASSLGGLGRTAASAGSRAAQTTGSGLLVGLRRLLAYFGQVATVILGNRRASITAGVAAAIVAARVGLVSLPEGTGILIVVAGVPVATWLILRQNNAASTRVWLGSTLAAVILGLEFVAPGTVQTAIEQLTSETVAPLLILVAAGGLYLWYRARQSDRPQIIIGGDSE